LPVSSRLDTGGGYFIVSLGQYLLVVLGVFSALGGDTDWRSQY